MINPLVLMALFLSMLFVNVSYARGFCAKNDISGNGCSDPTYVLSEGFEKACNAHDACYAAIGDPKHQCDKLFLADMQNKCYQRHVSCSGWKCGVRLLRAPYDIPAYSICLDRAKIVYETVNVVGSDLLVPGTDLGVHNTPRIRYRNAQDTAIENGIELAEEVALNNGCDRSTKSSKVFRPWFLEKKSRYPQLVKRSYEEVLGREPTPEEMANELSRANQTDKWGLLMLSDLDNKRQFISDAELEARQAQLQAEAEAEAEAARLTAQAEAEALAIIAREKDLRSQASLISYVY